MGKPIITLTDNAIKHVKSVLETNDKALGLRISVKSAGCSGHSYKFDLITDIDDAIGDTVVEQDGIKIFVEQKSLMYFLGAEMDFSEGKFKSGFTFKNPNEEDACGCGESVNFKRTNLPKM